MLKGSAVVLIGVDRRGVGRDNSRERSPRRVSGKDILRRSSTGQAAGQEEGRKGSRCASLSPQNAFSSPQQSLSSGEHRVLGVSIVPTTGVEIDLR